MHGSPIYTLWWEYLVRAYQSPNITVDRERYEAWGSPKRYLEVDIWSSKSRADAGRVWWKEHGRYLFAEAENRGVELFKSGQKLAVPNDAFCLQIPKGTPATEMIAAIKRLVHENVDASKTSHISTAQEHLSANEIRADAYRRWLKMYDMRFVPGCPNFDSQAEYAKDEEVFSIKFINEVHGTDDYPFTKAGNKSDIYRQLWKARKLVENVARGQFPSVS